MVNRLKNEKIVYFDNSATSWPKPKQVLDSMKFFIEKVGGSPGRSGHRMSINASRLIEEARESVCKLFNFSETSNVIFTKNATEALNICIFSLLKDGGNVITSSMEHNSVMRPIRYLEKQGVSVSIAKCSSDGILDPEEVFKQVKVNTKLIVLTHASNVTGTIFPIEEIALGAKEINIPLVIDCAQTAGVVPLNLNLDEYENCVVVFTGHKSLFGPTGTGGMCVGGKIRLSPLIYGGTGSKSDEDIQPDFLPDSLESGTLNVTGIIGLKAGIDFILKIGLDSIREHEKRLVELFIENIRNLKEIKVYGSLDTNNKIGIVSFNIENEMPSKIGLLLDSKYGIMCRVGLHCNPNAHKTIGTFPNGTIRFSFSYFNSMGQVKYAIKSVKELIKLLK